MRLKKRQIKFIITLLVAILSSAGIFAATNTGQAPLAEFAQEQNPGLVDVEKVADGDTISIRSQGKIEKIRLIGVDTPEKNDARKPIQCFAQAASNFTESKLTGKQVRLEADPQGDNRDRYGRLLRYVYLPDGTLVNKAIIEEGYGFAMTGFPFSKMEEFRAAQTTAREQNRGLWNTCNIDESKGYPQTNAAP